MYTEVLKVLHALATCILLFLAVQLKEIALRILMEVR
jgi:hypothetical protein